MADVPSVQLLDKMKCGKIIQKVDLTKMKKKASRDIILSCKRNEFVRKLDMLESFFKSKQWSIIHDEDPKYEIAFEVTKKVFGDSSFIYDNGNLIQGESAWNELNEDEKEFVKKIDTEKKEGIFNYGNLYVRYIGSSLGGWYQTGTFWPIGTGWPQTETV